MKKATNSSILTAFEGREFSQVFKTIRGKTMVKPLGWYILDGNQVAWYTPEDAQAKLLDMIPDEDEPHIEMLSYEAAESRINDIKAQGLRLINTGITERTPAGTYVSV